MKLLFDTDVVLDVLLDRKPHSLSAALLFSLAETDRISGFVCGTSVTTIHYLAAKVIGAREARRLAERLLWLFDVAPVNGTVLKAASGTRVADFEDAVVSEAARQVNADGIVTHNVRDYKRAAVRAYSPHEILRALDTGTVL